MTLAADTSIVIAAILAKHEAHEIAGEALDRATATIAHVAMETYSVLTRLPPPHRLDAARAATVVDSRLPRRWLKLSAARERGLLHELASAGVAGGSTYDGLIALTARDHGIQLVSLDRRAARTYRSLGVPFDLATA